MKRVRWGALVRCARRVLVAALFASVSTGVHAEPPHPLDEATVADRVEALLEQLDEHGGVGGPLDSTLDALLFGRDVPPAVREQVLHDFALRLREAEESPEGRRALERLVGYRSEVLVQAEGRGEARVPLWRVSGVAQGTLTQWSRAAETRELRSRLATRSLDLSSRSLVESSRAPLVAALASAPLEDVRAYRAALAVAARSEPGLMPAAAVVALRLRDFALCQAVFDVSDRHTAMQLLASLVSSFPAPQALQLLQDASASEDLGSVAIFQIGRLAVSLPAATAFLMGRLADPRHGGSAAGALARLADPAIVEQVASRLEATQDGTLQRKAALMLILDGSPAARQSLTRFSARSDVPEPLRREILQWLNP